MNILCIACGARALLPPNWYNVSSSFHSLQSVALCTKSCLLTTGLPGAFLSAWICLKITTDKRREQRVNVNGSRMCVRGGIYVLSFWYDVINHCACWRALKFLVFVVVVVVCVCCVLVVHLCFPVARTNRLIRFIKGYHVTQFVDFYRYQTQKDKLYAANEQKIEVSLAKEAKLSRSLL